MPVGCSKFAQIPFLMRIKLPFFLLFCSLILPLTVATGSTLKSKKIRTYELLVEEALKYKGTKYVFGGCKPGGFDCSGYVSYVYAKFNIELPRTSIDQSGAGKRVGLGAVKKGDLLFFRGSNIKDRTIGHVGIVISNKNEEVEFVHASTSRGVVVSKLSTEYYQKRFRKARCFKELNKKVRKP